MIASHLRKIFAVAALAVFASVPIASQAAISSIAPSPGPTDAAQRPLVDIQADTSGVRTAPGTAGTLADNVQPAAYTAISGALSSTASVTSTLGTAQSALISLNATAFVGSVIVEETDGGTNWYPVPAIRSDLSSYFTAATALSGAISFAYEPQLIPGATGVRLRVTAYTSGTLNVNIIPSALPALSQLSAGIPSGVTAFGQITAGNNATVLSNGSLAAGTPTATFSAGNGAHTMSFYINFTAAAAGTITAQCSTSGTNWFTSSSPAGTANVFTFAAAGTYSVQFAMQPCKFARLVSSVATTATTTETEYGL